MTRITAATNSLLGAGKDRQASVDAPPVGGRLRVEAAAEGAGPLAHADEPEVAGVGVRRRRRPGRGR